MAANTNSNEWDTGFTEASIETLSKSTDLALKIHSNEVKPLHMMLVLLCGNNLDVDNVDQLTRPDGSVLLWSVLEDLDADPIELAKEILRTLRRTTKPTHAATGSTGSDFLAPPKKSKEKTPSRRLFGRRPASPTPSGSTAVASRSVSPAPSDIREDRNSDAPPPPPSDALVTVLGRARHHKDRLGDSFVAPYHLLFAIADDRSVQTLLASQHVQFASFVQALKDRRQQARITNQEDNHFPFLTKYASDLSAAAREGKLSNIVGRDEEIRRVIQILCRRTKNSAILLGEPGVGKTAVAEGLAHRVAFGQVPQSLKGTIYSLDIGALFAGAGKGEYEQRVKGVIDDVMRHQESGQPIILFIDEIHLITVGKGSGGQSSGMDAANLLKPALARGQFRCIGATTLAEYREHIEKDGALERRFAPVMVNEPTIDEAITILRGIREKYEQHHRVWVMDQAIVTAVNLAHRFLTARRLPDSAVDLMDEACASARVSQDMKPEALDTLDKDKLHVLAHIKALERDNHPDDDKALADANKAFADMEEKTKRLERQQVKVKDWWVKVSVQRDTIQKKKHDLNVARSETRPNPGKILALEADLKKLRDALVQLEQRGPDQVEGGGDLFGRNRHSLSRTSPDTITPESIAEIVEKATKIPVQRLLTTDKGRLLNLEQSLSKQVVGQPEAVKAVTHAIQVSRTGLGNSNRPISSLLFTGPSGTGKTLLSKTLAQELFGQATSMIRIDGSEYSQSHSISRLIGSPPGYVGYDQGGQLTEYVRRTPYCIVLLDEIEKTCTEFLTLFLQVLDEGRLTDGQGRLVDFRNAVIIMTSNVGAQILSKEQGEISEQTRKKVMDCFREIHFPLEFLNRIEEVVMFRTMPYAVMRQILNNHLQALQEREGIKKLKLDIDGDAKGWLISVGISPEYGARPLARVIQRELLNPLSQRILEETIREGDVVIVRLNSQKNGLFIKPNHDPEPKQEQPVPGSNSRRGYLG